MLLRAALRLSKPRPTFASVSSVRGYANHQDKSSTKEPSPQAVKKSPRPAGGPVKNTTWGPRVGLNTSSVFDSSAKTRSKAPQVAYGASRSTRNFSVACSRYQSRPTYSSSKSTSQSHASKGTNGQSQHDNFSSRQPDFDSAADPKPPKSDDAVQADEVSTDPRLDQLRPPESLDADKVPQEPQGPLPDLRQGIPSTFGQQTSNQSSSFKNQDAEQPSLNLTEDPARSGHGRQDRAGELPREAYISSIERRRNKLANVMYAIAATAIISGAIWLGWDWETEEEARLHPDIPNGWAPRAFYGRMTTRLSQSLGYYTEPSFPKLLPEVDANLKPPHTLVLSLEDLLVHSKWSRQGGWEVAKRPGLDYFIRYLSQYYELVIFTTVPSMNGEMVYRKLDPYRLIMFPLFREATRYMNGEHVKDLTYLNRDLSKTLIIDTSPSHVKLQPENAILLPKWSGQPRDPHAADLVALIPFLEFIAAMSTDDVRTTLKSYEGKHIPTEYARREALAREAHEKRLASTRGGGRRSSSGGLFGSGGSATNMLGFKPAPTGTSLPGEPSVAAGLAAGKMMSDIIRERGRRQYEALDREIKANGSQWLEEQAVEEKKMMEEATRSMQGNPLGFLGMMFGGGAPPSGEAETGKK